MLKPFFKNLFIFILLVTTSHCFAFSKSKNSYTIDIYRSTQVTADQVDKQYHQQLSEIATLWMSKDVMHSQNKMLRIKNDKEKIIDGIKKMGNFAFIDLAVVLYPEDPVVHMTLDIVDQKDVYRLNGFLPKPKGSIKDPENLLKNWQMYEKQVMDNFMRTKVFKGMNVKDCPAFHCVTTFNEPGMAKYKNMFSEKVPKNKNTLITILRKDKDENKRAAAVFLLAHVKTAEEVIDALVPAICDSDGGVRNNVMRVLAQTVEKAPVDNFPVDKIITAADYPVDTDRNKALYVLFSLSIQDKYKPYIRQNAKNILLMTLRQNQPHIHDLTYQILKNVSGENFSDTDFSAWESWAHQGKS